MLELIRFPDPPRTVLGVLLPGAKVVSPALVDTGADLCVLPYQEGNRLGLPPALPDEQAVLLKDVPCVRRDIQIAIPTSSDYYFMNIPFMWAQEPNPVQKPVWDLILLGRYGFLDKIHLLDLYPIGFILFDNEGFSELVQVLRTFDS